MRLRNSVLMTVAVVAMPLQVSGHLISRQGSTADPKFLPAWDPKRTSPFTSTRGQPPRRESANPTAMSGDASEGGGRDPSPIGGDVFAVLLAWIEAPADGDQVAAKMAMAAQRPFSVAGQVLSLSVGLGVSQFPSQGKQADVLLRQAMEQASGSAAKNGSAEFALRQRKA